MKKVICIFCVCFLLLGCGCAKQAAKEPCLKPIEQFFDALNKGNYKKYAACHVPQLEEIEGSYAFEGLYIECRRDMLGEKSLYKIIEIMELKEDAVLERLRAHCKKYAIEYDGFLLIRLDSNLPVLPHGCYLVQQDGKWKILSWYPI